MNYFVLIFRLALLGSFALIQAQDELRIEITLTVPTNTPMESFSAQLAQGGVTGSAAKFSYLTLDMCSTDLSGSSQAQLTSLGIRRGLNVCAKGAVQVPNLKVLTTAADIALTSQNDDVTTNFVVSTKLLDHLINEHPNNTIYLLRTHLLVLTQLILKPARLTETA